MTVQSRKQIQMKRIDYYDYILGIYLHIVQAFPNRCKLFQVPNRAFPAFFITNSRLSLGQDFIPNPGQQPMTPLYKQ
jgi:hypothetical protein